MPQRIPRLLRNEGVAELADSCGKCRVLSQQKPSPARVKALAEPKTQDRRVAGCQPKKVVRLRHAHGHVPDSPTGPWLPASAAPSTP